MKISESIPVAMADKHEWSSHFLLKSKERDNKGGIHSVIELIHEITNGLRHFIAGSSQDATTKEALEENAVLLLFCLQTFYTEERK